MNDQIDEQGFSVLECPLCDQILIVETDRVECPNCGYSETIEG